MFLRFLLVVGTETGVFLDDVFNRFAPMMSLSISSWAASSAVSRKVIVLTFSLMIVHPLSCRQSWLVEGLAPVAAGSSLPPVGMLPHTSGSVFRISR